MVSAKVLIGEQSEPRKRDIGEGEGCTFCPACGSKAVRRRKVLRGKKRPQPYDEITCFDCHEIYILRKVKLERPRELFPCAECGGPTCVSSGYEGNRCEICAARQAGMSKAYQAEVQERRAHRRAAEVRWRNLSSQLKSALPTGQSMLAGSRTAARVCESRSLRRKLREIQNGD